MKHCNVVKPRGELSHTDWLTDAADAEPGMVLHQLMSDGIESKQIVEVGRATLTLSNDEVVSIDMVNKRNDVVVE